MNNKKVKKLRRFAKILGTGNSDLHHLLGKPTVISPKSFKYISKVLKNLPKGVFNFQSEMIKALVMSEIEAREKELISSGYQL